MKAKTEEAKEGTKQEASKTWKEEKQVKPEPQPLARVQTQPLQNKGERHQADGTRNSL